MGDQENCSDRQSTDVPDEGKEILRKEARTVLAAQLKTLRESDEKAIATVRITGLILGLVISAISISEQPEEAFTGEVLILFGLGGFSLLVSIVFGILSYSADRPSFGLGPGYFDREMEKFDETNDIYDDLLNRYADWIEDNSEEIATDGTYLNIALLLLVVGLVLFGVGAVILIL